MMSFNTVHDMIDMSSGLKVCGKTVNYRFSYFLRFIAVNLNNGLSKTINDFHYRIAIKQN